MDGGGSPTLVGHTSCASRVVAVALLHAAALSHVDAARADDHAEAVAPQPILLQATPAAEVELPEPLTPPTLPSLTHEDVLLQLDYTGAGIGRGSLGQTFTYMAHAGVEVPVLTRNVQAGFAWDLVSATAEDHGRALLYGNPELWARAATSHASGVSAGGGLGVVVPLPRDLSSDGEVVLDSLRVIRPWDTSYFSSDVGALRPSLDARLVVSPFVLQLRQGLDLLYDFSSARTDILARLGAYAGYAPLDWLCVSVELWQTYSITAEVPDGERAAFSLSPAIRFRAPPLQPGISFLFPVSTPLEGIATAYLAVRFHVELALGEKATVK